LYRAVNTLNLGYKNQSFYVICGRSHSLFSDKYKTHKYGVDKAYSCGMSEHVGASRNQEVLYG